MASQGPAHGSWAVCSPGDFCDGFQVAFPLSEAEAFVLQGGTVGAWVEELREGHIAYVCPPLLPSVPFSLQGVWGDRRRMQVGEKMT